MNTSTKKYKNWACFLGIITGVFGASCGKPESKTNSQSINAYVAGIPNLNYSQEFSCRLIIDSENKQDSLAPAFALSSGRIIVTFQIYADKKKLKVATARISQSSRIITGSKYFQDINENSDLSLLADVVGTDNTGIWNFSTTKSDNKIQASFNYTDSDLDQQISSSFPSNQCAGAL